MFISREVEKELKTLLREYPVVTILGPRQAGKTTLSDATQAIHFKEIASIL